MSVNEKLLRELEAQAHREKPYPSPLFPPSVYYRFFRLLAAATKPRLSVVLGVCGGGDALHLSLGWGPGTVVGVDHAWDHPDQIGYIRAVCGNYRHLIADSVDVASRVREDYGPVDILFVDTTHTWDQTWSEYHAWRPRMAEGGIMAFDDLFRSEMRNIWEELPGRKLRMDSLHDGSSGVGGGFGVIYGLD
jgi:predicted O-methyltransferase YrrM